MLLNDYADNHQQSASFLGSEKPDLSKMPSMGGGSSGQSLPILAKKSYIKLISTKKTFQAKDDLQRKNSSEIGIEKY